MREPNGKKSSIKVDQHQRQGREKWAFILATAVLCVGVSGISFVLGYATGNNHIERDIGPTESPVSVESTPTPLDNLANSNADKEEKRTVWFDDENEEHMNHVESFGSQVREMLENYRTPDSITQEIVDFLDFNLLFARPRGQFTSLSDELQRYRHTFCRAGDFIESKYNWIDHWSIVGKVCSSRWYGYAGTSPGFTLYWSKFNYENIEYDFPEIISEDMYIKLNEIQFERIESIRVFLSQPDNLRHIFEVTRNNIKSALEDLDPDQRIAIAKRVKSAIESANTVMENCGGALCDIEEPDYSSSNDPSSFVSKSPIKNLINYDLLLASEIYEIEFFVRRHNEGGTTLVNAYRDILIEIEEMAAKQTQ